jgi:hypothetical protein
VVRIVERYVEHVGLASESLYGHDDRIDRIAASVADGLDELAGAVIAQVDLAVLLVVARPPGRDQ